MGNVDLKGEFAHVLSLNDKAKTQVRFCVATLNTKVHAVGKVVQSTQSAEKKQRAETIGKLLIAAGGHVECAEAAYTMAAKEIEAARKVMDEVARLKED